MFYSDGDELKWTRMKKKRLKNGEKSQILYGELYDKATEENVYEHMEP